MFDFVAWGPVILALAFWDAVGFWVLAAVILTLICFDQGAISFAVLVISALAAYWLGFLSLGLVMANEKAMLWFLVFYIPIGLFWATGKWWWYCIKLASKVQKYLADREVMMRAQAKGNNDDFVRLMNSVRENLRYVFHDDIPPTVSQHKADFMRWMCWWPFSMVASVISDLIQEFFTFLYNKLGDLWQKISNHAFRNVDYQNPEPPAPAE